MNKFLIPMLLVLAILLIDSSSVAAKKTDWVDKNYKFSEIHNVFICDVDTSVFDNLENSLAEQIKIECKNSANKIKRIVIVDSEELADVKVMPKIIACEEESVYVPEEVYYKGYETVSDRDGKVKERRYKKSKFWFSGATKYVIPAHYVTYSVMKVSFNVYNVKNGELIMSREDNRDRAGSNNHLNMYKRSCNAFFKTLSKKIK